MAFIETLRTKPEWKRHLWLISLTFPTTPLLGIALALATGNPHWVWLPVAIFYVLVPALDYFVGDDKYDLLGLIQDEVSRSKFYKFMVHAMLPAIYLTWVGGAWFFTKQSWPWDVYLALGLSHGWGLAFAINAGHETGHKTDKVSKWFALFMLLPSFYGHFRVEHNMGHHSDVATPRDHATSRFGESYYQFMSREYPGAWKRSWKIEKRRADRKGYSRFSLKNEVVLATDMALILWSVMIVIFGVSVLAYMLLAWFVSATALTSQNYIAHYGLLRDRRPDGKFLPCEPHHSWNCNLLVTNLTSFNLARHSDHHANPSRHYQYLRQFQEVPALPFGYMLMFLIGYVPPLFRRVMDPLVLKGVNGDMNKVLTKDLVCQWEAEQSVVKPEANKASTRNSASV
ncbi:alkane 1-monooxygenase [Litorimonas haliclonae]|uniref:alkane 1-monooxygenase n=1 Tax=Litorimonas haliclonae TaxID=2081977 RepID=UPI0039F126A1